MKKKIIAGVSALLLVAGISIVIFNRNDNETADNRWQPNTDASYVTGGTADDVHSATTHHPSAPSKAEEEWDEDDNPYAEPIENGLARRFIRDLEMPAEIVASKMNETILCKTAFTISYNSKTLCPNYVAWHLTTDRVSSTAGVKRTDKFMPDFVLGERVRVTTQDYANSGYDRGHMCPAADCKHDEKAMEESFYMTNICPQSHNLNAGDWKELEEQCRQWVKDYSDIYIVAGPIFDSQKPQTIGKRKDMKICVPDRFFKVILMMEPTPKAIGFIYPNHETNQEMRSYSTSVDEVERITTLDFFHNLPDDVERKIERVHNPAEWGI